MDERMLTSDAGKLYGPAAGVITDCVPSLHLLQLKQNTRCIKCLIQDGGLRTPRCHPSGDVLPYGPLRREDLACLVVHQSLFVRVE